MKKLISAILVLMMVFAFASSAMASTAFHIVTDSTSILQVGTSQFAKSRAQWYVVVDMGASNISATHRAVTRVHNGTAVASATWVYSGSNSSSHPYSSGIATGQGGLTYRGRLDDRDSGLLEFHGTFYN